MEFSLTAAEKTMTPNVLATTTRRFGTALSEHDRIAVVDYDKRIYTVFDMMLLPDTVCNVVDTWWRTNYRAVRVVDVDLMPDGSLILPTHQVNSIDLSEYLTYDELVEQVDDDDELEERIHQLMDSGEELTDEEQREVDDALHEERERDVIAFEEWLGGVVEGDTEPDGPPLKQRKYTTSIAVTIVCGDDPEVVGA
jgi:hypothetical protein